MNEGTRKRRYRVTFIVKLLVVLLFPIGFRFSFPNLDYISILLRVSESGDIALTSIISLLFGLLVMLPCLIFEYHLHSRPVSKSYSRRAAIACTLSWVTSFLLYFFSGIWLTVSNLYLILNFTPILAISFYVILPLLTRESVLRRIAPEHRDLPYGFVKSSVLKGARRESFLTGLLWVGLVFAPFMGIVSFSMWSSNLLFWSLFYQLTAYAGTPWYDILTLNVLIELAANMTIFLPLVVLLSSIRFVFVRDVFGFQTGRITKSRLASVAILGEILPSAVVTLSQLVLLTSVSFIPVLLPIPVLPLIGFGYVRFSKIVPLEEVLWPDYEHRMWYEKKREPYVAEPPEESITVPLAYLLLSQIRKRRKSSE